MKNIFVTDLKKAILSIKSLFIITFFCIVSYFIGYNYDAIGKASEGTLVTTLYNSIETFGILFGFLLFSGIVSKMVENESIRYITPYLSRYKIITSKYLVIFSYFILLLLLMLPIVMISSKVVIFPVKEFLQAFIFFAYISSIILLLSVVTRTERRSTFIGIFAGILIPILGVISIFSKNILVSIFSWLLPYRYGTLSIESIVLVLLTGIVFSVTIIIFQNEEL